ncbi:TetR family transcriptional regulator [Ketobacter sp. MCCC 1A13808]|uniref:TetR/AcrR family transcriptional regulator n=1 Tax=Ketobacter sp. MCCC 1A13808 TaxID=2602738 RepID=UPI000F15046E|nr:TetR/AcrR family transcriptional regulator [Ketobacter sp. MCCC 1A13808]MVF12017.1 TetR family transcriptional regulator [Ketobacter sp. MCCC 1A13808]RLP52747.1 MAG: TetR family transcriptional regulator [Ketobacter sp.]
MKWDIASHRDDKPAGRIRQKNEDIIIAAAEAEFAHNGFKGATMNNIAQRADLPKSNIHYYFKNKLQLYIEVLTNIIDLWDNALNDLDGDAEPGDALRAYITEKMRFSYEYPLASKVFAKEILSGAPRLAEYFNDDYQDWFNSKTHVFRRWAEQGKIDPVEPAHIVFLLWSSTQHYSDFEVQISAALGKKKLNKKDFEEATDVLCKIVIRGLGVKED